MHSIEIISFCFLEYVRKHSSWLCVLAPFHYAGHDIAVNWSEELKEFGHPSRHSQLTTVCQHTDCTFQKVNEGMYE